MYFLAKKIYFHLDRKNRISLLVTVLMMCLASFLDIISIGMLIPFLSALSSPKKLFDYKIIALLSEHFSVTNASEIVLPSIILFASTTLLASVFRIFLIKRVTNFTFMIGQVLSKKLYTNIVNSNYSYFLTSNSSETINALTSQLNSLINSGILCSFNFLSSILLACALICGLLIINVKITLFLSIFFIFIYSLIIYFSRKRIKNNADVIAITNAKLIKIIQESLGGIRDIIIGKHQNIFISKYLDQDKALRSAQSSNTIISTTPRFLIEGLGIFLLSLSTIIIVNDTSEALPIATLGIIAMGSQKLLPAIQQIYWSLTEFKGNSASFNKVLNILDLTNNINNMNYINSSFDYSNSIKFRNVNIKYPSSAEDVLNKIDLDIYRGDIIGIVGRTGAGKSTALDMIMGLISPSSGTILIDDKNINLNQYAEISKFISHVPQHIFLLDDTIEKNIAFGLSESQIDNQRLFEVISKCELNDYIASLPLGIKTIVGERGINLSGGQIQRIGIARALYSNKSIVVLDEATSALDVETEARIIKNLEKLDKKITIIMVTHRKSTLHHCTKIYKIYNKTIYSTSFSDLQE
jgi:ATP-binding cassette subfamily B protein